VRVTQVATKKLSWYFHSW